MINNKLIIINSDESQNVSVVLVTKHEQTWINASSRITSPGYRKMLQYKPLGQTGLMESYLVTSLIQNDLLTFVLSTVPSRWNSAEHELFTLLLSLPWDLHPSSHWKWSVFGHPESGFGIPYVPAGQRFDPKKNSMFTFIQPSFNNF